MPNTGFFSWINLFFVAASAGFFIAALLLTHRRGNRVANRLLGLVIFLFSITLVANCFFWNGHTSINYQLFGVMAYLSLLLFGPLFLMYTNRLYGLPVKRAWLHLLPWLLCMLLVLPIVFNIQPVLKTLYAPHRKTIGYITNHGFVYMYCISLTGYSWYLWQRHRRQGPVTGGVAQQQHRWTKRVILYFCAYTASVVSYYVLAYLKLMRLEYDYLISSVCVVFIYATGIAGFRQPELFGYVPANGRKNGNGKYEKSSLKKNRTETLAVQLKHLMNEEKMYLDSELTLQSLAAAMHCSTHHLSQVINEQFGVTYPELVNRYRVEEACRILGNPRFQEEKILGVAFDVGYNNKATFNMVFKRITGITPSEYRKNAVRNTEAAG